MDKILYVNSMVDNDTYRALFSKKEKPMHAANKYHTLLCKGFVKNEVDVEVFSALPVNSNNCDKKIVKVNSVKQDGYVIKYPSFVNFPIFRHFKLFLSGFFKAIFCSKNTTILYDALVVSLARGASLGAKITAKKTVAVVTDFPEFLASKDNVKRNKVFHKIIDSSSGYIFLTEQMNERLNKNAKPYVVIEGLVDSDMENTVHKEFSRCKKKVVYAGTLLKMYGIKNLCESFIKVCKPDEELHVYGDGDYVPELNDLVNSNKNVYYHGNCLNEVVVSAELESVLMVNPRPNVGEYTKYSFPSKTLEYMVSGTPLLTAKLDGIPSEYYNYVFSFESSLETDLSNKLRKILDMPLDELEDFGSKAKMFAIDNKNNVKQARKIIEFISNLR